MEYALLLALIAVVALGAVSYLGRSTGGNMLRSNDCMEAAAAGNTLPANCT